MKNYKVIIFDLDGTLSNSEEGITKSVQYALEKLGIIVNDLDSLKHFIGPPMAEELEKSYNLSKDDAFRGLEYYRERYIPVGIYECYSYEGVEEMLATLKRENYIVALATSKPQVMAEEVLRYLNINKYFDYIMGADLHGPKQSKDMVLESLIEEIKCYSKEEMLMVGDTSFDIIGASKVGIDSIGVKYGFGEIEQMLSDGAVCVVDSPSDIISFLHK